MKVFSINNYNQQSKSSEPGFKALFMPTEKRFNIEYKTAEGRKLYEIASKYPEYDCYIRRCKEDGPEYGSVDVDFTLSEKPIPSPEWFFSKLFNKNKVKEEKTPWIHFRTCVKQGAYNLPISPKCLDMHYQRFDKFVKDFPELKKQHPELLEMGGFDIQSENCMEEYLNNLFDLKENYYPLLYLTREEAEEIDEESRT